MIIHCVCAVAAAVVVGMMVEHVHIMSDAVIMSVHSVLC